MPQKMAGIVSAIVMAGSLTLTAAPTPVIGMVTSAPGQSGLSIDGARVSGNATLFDGSLVSAMGYSRLELKSGTRVDLGADSVVHVYANHVSLEGGSSEVQSSTHYTIDARSLKIEPSEAGAIARVRLDGDQRVLVTAVTAPVNVWNRYGLLVARVTPAAPLSFLPQVANSAFSNSGCVVNKSNAAVFVDQTGNQVSELRSTSKSVDLRKFVGKRAAVTGTVTTSTPGPVQGATQVVNVTSIAPASGGDCSPVAARIGATTTAAGLAAGGAAAGAGAAAAGAGAAAGAAAGISTGVIVGVAAASAVAIGTTVAVVTSGSSSP